MIRWHQPMGSYGLLGRFGETLCVWTGLYILFGKVLLEGLLNATTAWLAFASGIALIVAIFGSLVDVRRPSKRGTEWPIHSGDTIDRAGLPDSAPAKDSANTRFHDRDSKA